MPRRKQPPAPQHPVSNAAKWAALFITSGAAMVSFLSDSDSIGLFGWFAAEGLSLSDYMVRDIRLTPRADTASAIGDTVYLAATVTDKRGATVLGSTVLWNSLDPSVATVDSSGRAVVRGPGRTGIVATVREYNDTSWVVASQELAGVKIDLDSTFVVPEQESRPLFAMAVDARRHEILGQPVRWSTSDASVLRVDSLGTATGVVPGSAVVTASAGPYRSQATIRVVQAAGRIAPVGEVQRAAVGTPLRHPVAVRAWSRGGTPLEEAVVRFQPLYGHGSVDPEETTTDGQGVARTQWTLGPEPGRQYLRVAVEGADSAIMIEAEADPSPHDLRMSHLHDELTGRFATTLADTVVIEVTDSLGRIRPDLPVAWSAQDGGTVAPIDQRTDSLGQAKARWTLGPKAGRQRLEVVAGNPRTIPPYVITAVAEPGTVASAEIIGGDKQRGTVGKGLAKAVIVRALDRHDNPVPGIQVTVEAEAGSIPDTEYVTDALGQIAVPWTLGRSAGTQRLAIRVDGVTAPLIAKATAAARGPANVEFVDPPAAGRAGRPLSRRVVVRVTDVYGNPVADREVFFSGPAGIVNPQRAMTDDAGETSTKWTLGSKTGRSWLQASVKGTALKTIMKIDVK